MYLTEVAVFCATGCLLHFKRAAFVPGNTEFKTMLNITDGVLPAIGRRAPAAVRIGRQAPPQQELLILLQQGRVVQDVGHLLRGQPLGALGAAELDPALRDLNAQVLPQATQAGAVAAPQQLRELVGRLAHQAQGALQEVRLLRGGGSGEARLAGGQRL